MIDDRQPAAIPTAFATLPQVLEDTFDAQTEAMDLAVRRGTLDLGAAAALLESQVAVRDRLHSLLRAKGRRFSRLS
jgi:hypothetical protein